MLLRILVLLFGMMTFATQAIECEDCTPEQVQSAEFWEQQWQPIRNDLMETGPVMIVAIRSENPSTTLMGFHPPTQTCIFMLNINTPLTVSPTDMLIAMSHEAGHCQALRTGFQTVEAGTTKRGEAYADVWGLAWINKNSGHIQFKEAYRRLLEIRWMSRQQSREYDTLIPVRTAGEALLATREQIDPTTFAERIMKDFK